MSTAIVGIIGVIAGALATTGTQIWMNARQRHNDALASSRLVWGGLEDATRLLESALDGSTQGANDWAPGSPEIKRSLSVWDENRIAVARSVDALGYRVLEVAFLILRETIAKAEPFDGESFAVVTSDPRLPSDLVWLRKARSVALRASQTKWQRITDTRKKRKVEAEVAAEVLSIESELRAREAGVP